MSQEPIVPPAKESGSLITPLASAIIWMVYFMLVYLIAEARCRIAFLDYALLGASAASVVTVVLTVTAIGVIAVYTVGSWRRWKQETGPPDVAEQGNVLGLLGVVSGGIFAIATLSVGIPVLFLPPC